MTNGRDQLDEYLSHRNALSLADNIADYRRTNDERVTSLERQVTTLTKLVQRQNQVIGEAMQRLMGTGSTEADDGDHH